MGRAPVPAGARAVVAVAAVAVALVACGGAAPPASPSSSEVGSNAATGDAGGSSVESSAARRPGDGVGSPVGRNGSGTVIASPVRVPLPTNTISGRPYPIAVQLLEPKIREACGGDLCLRIGKEPSGTAAENEGEACEIVDSAKGTVDDPDGSGEGTLTVERDGTIVLFVNYLCDGAPSPRTPTTSDASSPTTTTDPPS